MTTQVTPFQFHAQNVRVITDDDGKPWFVAADLARILGYRDATAAARYLPDHLKCTLSGCTPHGTHPMICVNEPGLYRMIMRSDRPEAEPFIEWVTAEVLPAIRKSGGYQAHPEPEPVTEATRDYRDTWPATVTVDQQEYNDLLKTKIKYLEAQLAPQRVRLTDDEKTAIARLHAMGWSAADIGQRIGRDKSTVGSYIRNKLDPEVRS